MVNRGEEKVWVQMNVVPRSTGNTNSGTRELTLKCKLKCYFKPMNNPLRVSPSKGKQGTTRGKESSPTFSVRPCSSVGRVTVDLIRRSWVRFPPRSKDFFFASCGSLFPFTRANAQWVIYGFKVALISITCLQMGGSV